jgi:hypothetical protein
MQAPVSHACNPSYSRGRNQEDPGSKPARQIVHQIQSSKTLHKNRAGGVAKTKALSTAKKKKKKKGWRWL